MKNYALLLSLRSVIFFLFLGFIVFSCERKYANEQKQSFSKEELTTIYTEYTDDEIASLGIDIDQLIATSFSLLEREKLLIKRTENFSPPEGVERLKAILNGYREKYGESYLDEKSTHQEEFAKELMRKENH